MAVVKMRAELLEKMSDSKGDWRVGRALSCRGRSKVGRLVEA